MTTWRFITEDRSHLKSFVGTGTGATVLYNTCEDRFLLLRQLSPDEWSSLQEEMYEALFTRRMAEMSEFRSDRNILKAFDWYADKRRSLLHLRKGWLAAAAPELTGPHNSRISQRIAKLSKEQQLDLWKRIQPKSTAEAKSAFLRRYWRQLAGLDIESLLAQRRNIGDLIEILAALLYCPNRLASNAVRQQPVKIIGREFKQTAHLILIKLRDRGVLLYSLGMRDELPRVAEAEYKEKIRPGFPTKIVLNTRLFKPDLFRFALKRHTDQSPKGLERSSTSYVTWFLLSTTAIDIGDMSPELLSESRKLSLSSYKWWRDIYMAYEADSRYGPASFPTPPKSRVRDAVRTRSLDWAVQERPDLEVWTSLFDRMIMTQYRTYKTSEYTNARFFFRWMIDAQKRTITPETLHKDDIRCENGRNVEHTFRHFLDMRVSESSRDANAKPIRNVTKSTAVRQLHRVMEFHRQENLAKIEKDPTLVGKLRVDNPVSLQDGTWKIPKSSRTHRTAISAEILDFAREILLEVEDGVPKFTWFQNSKPFQRDWIEVDGIHAGKWPFERRLSDSRIEIWQPSRALALYVMLEIPLRSFQVRWLDSGAGDEFIWDFTTSTLIRNPRLIAEAGRAQGVFQPIEEAILAEVETLGFYVTTNKTQQWNPEDNQGFLIPWPSNFFYKTLDLQRQWCTLAAEIFHTTAVKLSDDDMNVHERVRDLLPEFHVLFRDASNFAGQTRPISRAKMDAGWAVLCEEVQRRLALKNVVVKLASRGANCKVRALHDLHTLRVSGITNLYLKGVPVEIISRYLAGHAAIAMTLHYEASSPIEIRKRLASWIESGKVVSDGDNVAALLDLIENDKPISVPTLKALFGENGITRLLLTNSFGGDPASLINAAADTGGTWAWYGDGICPAARCSQGDESGGPVKGGPRSCGNCRFFLTGVAFLYGQAHRCNQIMYELRRLGTERAAWYAKKRGAALSSPAIAEIDARIGELDAQIEPKLSDWWGRYKLLQKTLKHANNADGSRELVASPTDAITVAIEQTSHSHLLKELCQSGDILNMDQDSLAPVMELRAIINVLLSRHGVSPFLVGVPDSAGRQLTTIIADAIQRLFQAHYNCNEVSAHKKIQELVDAPAATSDPILAAGLKQLAMKLATAEQTYLNDHTTELPASHRQITAIVISENSRKT